MKHLLNRVPTARHFLFAATAATCLSTAGTAYAQQGGGGMGQGQGRGGMQGQQGQNRGQMREQQLRQMLTNAGYPDKALQDLVINFSNTQDKTKQALRQQMNALRQAVSDDETSEEQTAGLLADLRGAVEKAKTQWFADIKTLDTLIGFSKKPKLEALLTVQGLIGEESAFIGGGGGMGGPGGGQGRGGGMGGPGGGQGGGFDGQGMGGGFGGPGGGMGGPGGPPPGGDF